jgi:uncharacterized protein (DUF433 family)
MGNAYVESRPEIMMGKPVIAGTRITIEHVLEEIAGGATIADLLESHPELTAEQIRAAILYAAEAVRTEVVVPAKPAE